MAALMIVQILLVVALIAVGAGSVRLTTPLVEEFAVGPVILGSLTMGPLKMGPVSVEQALIGLVVLWLVLGLSVLFTPRERSKKKGEW